MKLYTAELIPNIGGWGEESATGKSVSVSFRVRVVRAVRASGRGEAA